MTTQENNITGKTTGKFKAILLWTGGFIAFFVIGYLLLSSLSIAQVEAFDRLLMDFSVGFLLFRWFLFLVLMFYWREAIAWLGHKKQWSEAHLAKIVNNRWQVILLFITLELIFNHRSYLSALP